MTFEHITAVTVTLFCMNPIRQISLIQFKPLEYNILTKCM